MNWQQRYRWKLAARNSLVLWGALSLVAAMLSAPAVRWIDRETGWTLFRFSADGARALLAMLAGTMLTFIVFVLSTTLIVVQLASGQLTPRVIGLILTTPLVKTTLAMLTFTYVYTLSALARVEERVPDLHVSAAVVLNLVCLIVFFRFVQQLSTGLRPASLMLLVADRGCRVIDDVYPLHYAPERPEQSPGNTLPAASGRLIEFGGRAGVVLGFSASEIARLAERADVLVELLPQVGDSIARGDPLFRIVGSGPILEEDLHGCIAVGVERTMDQDPRFAFRILVDIASKALSPAINDPTTAVLAIDQIDNLLLELGRRRLDEGVVRDASGKVRLVYGTPDWPDYVMLGVSEVRQFGGGSIQVDRRLRAMLEHLISSLPETRQPPLQAELDLLKKLVERQFADEEDRKRAGVADYQGMGGSDS